MSTRRTNKARVDQEQDGSLSFLPSRLAKLEAGLQSIEVAERTNCVHLLGQMYCDDNVPEGILDSGLWKAFLGRFGDIDAKVRLKCVQYSAGIIKQHPDLQPDLAITMKQRVLDTDENVRHEVIKSLAEILKNQPCSLVENEELVELMKDRVYDKKVNIRRDALKGLARIYKKHLEHLTESQVIPAEVRRIATGIKNKILHVYYMHTVEDRILVERLLNSCLVPYNLEPSDRMSKLLYLFVTMDENAIKAFREIQRNTKVHRKLVSELLNCVKSHSGTETERPGDKLNIILSGLSGLFVDPTKMIKFLFKFCADLKGNKEMMKTMETIVNPVTDCATNANGTNSVLKKLGTPSVNDQYYSSVKTLLERCSSVLVDKVAIQELVRLMLYIGDDIDEALSKLQIDLPPLTVLERAAQLVSILADTFPSYFCYEDMMDSLKKVLSIRSPSVLLNIFKTFQYVGAGNQPLSNVPSSILWRQLTKKCMASMNSDNPKLGKAALQCLLANLDDDEQKEMAKSIVAQLGENLSTSPNCVTAIVVLGHVAQMVHDLHDEDLDKDLKKCISRKVIKDILINPQRSEENLPKSQSEWCSEEELPLITQCMISGLKCVTRWIFGLKTDVTTALNVFKMLSTFVKTSGTFVSSNEDFPLSTAEKSWLRLTAGCCLLKIFAHKEIGDRITGDVPKFCDLACLMTDEVLEVRSRFALKLHNGLSRRFPYGCLPLEFMGFYSLGGFEGNLSQRDVLKKYLLNDILKRRNYLKTLTTNGNLDAEKFASRLRDVLPDYALVYSIPVLTNHPKFTSYQNVDELRNMESCLWFILEPLVLKNEHYSYAFFKTALERIKNCTTGLSEEQDNKMYAICDLAKGLILNKGQHFEMNYPAGQAPAIPTIYFKPHSTPGWTNARYYLPPTMKIGTPSSIKGRKRSIDGSAEKKKRTPVRKRTKKNDRAAGDESSENTENTGRTTGSQRVESPIPEEEAEGGEE